MLTVPERLTSVVHPLVSSIYLKKGYGTFDKENILVIETNFTKDDEDTDLMDLLGDLKDLQAMACEKIGAFDRVDIRAAA